MKNKNSKKTHFSISSQVPLTAQPPFRLWNSQFTLLASGGQEDLEIAQSDGVSVASARDGFHKKERQHGAAQAAVVRGKMTFTDALQTCRERLEGDHSIKEGSKVYREERMTALLKSWPNLSE